MKTWAERFSGLSQEDRLMTIAEDGSTLDALIKEASAAPEMQSLLEESQRNIGGTWRERRDALLERLNGDEE